MMPTYTQIAWHGAIAVPKGLLIGLGGQCGSVLHLTRHRTYAATHRRNS